MDSTSCGACREISFTAFSVNPMQMLVAKGCCTWMGAFLPAISHLYSVPIQHKNT